MRYRARPKVSESEYRRRMRIRRLGSSSWRSALTAGSLQFGAATGSAVACRRSSQRLQLRPTPTRTYGFSFDYPADWQVVTGRRCRSQRSGADPTEVGHSGRSRRSRGRRHRARPVHGPRVRAQPRWSMRPRSRRSCPVSRQLVADFQSQDPSFEVVEPLTETEHWRAAGLSGRRAPLTGTPTLREDHVLLPLRRGHRVPAGGPGRRRELGGRPGRSLPPSVAASSPEPASQ